MGAKRAAKVSAKHFGIVAAWHAVSLLPTAGAALATKNPLWLLASPLLNGVAYAGMRFLKELAKEEEVSLPRTAPSSRRSDLE